MKDVVGIYRARAQLGLAAFCERACRTLLCACVLSVGALSAHADAGATVVVSVQNVAVYGASRTRLDTILDLLPRAPPALYTEVELLEFERRLANLGIFDLVKVTRSSPTTIDVQVREKWTLIPMFDLSTGSSWRDTFVSLSATEYNLLGRALMLTAAAWHEARGWNGSLFLAEHGYHPSRGAFTGTFEYATGENWYEESGDAWSVRGPGVLIQYQAPIPHGRRFAYQFGLAYSYEDNLDPVGRVKPRDGNYFNAELVSFWENFRWSDFAPHGVHIRVKLLPGVFLSSGPPAPRMAAELYMLGAHAFSNVFVLMAQVNGSLMNRGNPNFSYLLGSFGGVRGLQDASYHTWVSCQLNVELRYTLKLAERWALQGVLFSDGAVFDRVDARGRDASSGWAVSSGLGVRLVPSFLAGVVLRVDAGRALYPTPSYFWQWGLSQYF